MHEDNQPTPATTPVPSPAPASTAPAAGVPSSIARRAVSGAMWSTAAGLFARALALLGTIIIVRFLAPAEYGQVQNASVLVLTASQFATLGVGAYIIAFPRSGRSIAFHATVIHVGLGVLAVALVWLFRHQLGPLVDVPAFPRFAPGLILSVMLDRLSYMAERPVVRDLGFGRVSLSRTLGELTYTTVSVYSAWQGAGAMAVVYGNVGRSAVRLAVMLLSSDWRDWALPTRIDGKTMRVLVPYGTVVAVQAAAEFGSRRWDNLLVARLFGSGVAGHYVLAYNLADVPAIQIGEQIADVLMASYSHVEPENRTAAVLRAAGLMTMVMAPLSIGLGAVGPSVANAFFKPEWAMIGTLLMVLSIGLVSRPIGSVFSTYLMIVKGPKVLMYVEIITVLLLLALILTVGRLGVVWVCAMVGVAMAARALMCMWHVQRLEGLRMTAVARRCLPIFAACVPMFLAVVGVRLGLPRLGVNRPGVSLVLEVVAGGLVYAGAVSLLARQTVKDFTGLLKGALRRRLGSE
jgi:lipopolysaccharide exporter